MTIYWQVSVDGGDSWRDVGSTENPVYVTMRQPIGDKIYDTVVHIGCKNADGLTDEGQAVAAIWNEFADCNVERIYAEPPAKK